MDIAGRLMPSPDSTAIDLAGKNESPNTPDTYSVPSSMNASQASPNDLKPQNQSYSQYTHRNIGDLLQDLTSSLPPNRVLDAVPDFSAELNKHMYALINHRLMPILYGVLSELKDKTGLTLRPDLLAQADHIVDDPQVQRLDTMLIAEGVIEPPPNYIGTRPNSQMDSAIENADYRSKLAGIKQWYNEKQDSIECRSKEFSALVLNLLLNQSNARPILPEYAEAAAVKLIEKKMRGIQIQLKQIACEAVMSLRSRFLDARRKRRNFSKQATEILTNYFYAHLSNPYPSEEVKEELAKQCNISVSQVNNWFGNKRIRYKKNLGKEEANSHAAKKTMAAERSSPYPLPSSRSHGTPTPPIPSPALSVSSQGSDFPPVYGMNLGSYPGHAYSSVPAPGYNQQQRSSPADSQ